jgi:nucleotide-binding universal stress UspA family protein
MQRFVGWHVRTMQPRQEQMMFEHILVPVDGSADATRALELAIDEARQHGAGVSVVFALDIDSLQQLPFDAPVDAEAIEHARAYVEREGKVVEAAGVPLRAATAETGAPADTILEAARDGVDLIVMSTHGLGRSGRYALGSVAMKVLMGAKCPVLLLRSP